MLIVDSQVHIWGADTPDRPWPKRAEPQRPVPLGKDDLLREMDAAGVDQLVPLLTEGHMDWIWGEAEKAGVPIYVLVPHRLAHLIDRVAEQHPLLKLVMDHLGLDSRPQRLFWGTDLSRSPIPYSQHVTMFTEEIPWLTSEDKEWIMGRGVCEWLDWEVR